MFEYADAAQWSYYFVVLFGIYYIALSLRWLKDMKWKADKFFYYILAVVGAIVISHAGASYARYQLLSGDIAARNQAITSWWWAARSHIMLACILIVNFHATIRYRNR